MDRCGECGFRYSSVDQAAIGLELVTAGSRYGEVLFADDESLVPVRRAPEVWSPLEYAAHVRDLLLVQRERILLALVVDAPTFFPMYRDERVELARYAREDPEAVIDGIEMGGQLLDHVFARLDAQQLGRPCFYGAPSPQRRTLLWVGQHTVHEIRHHLLDIERQLHTES